MQSKSIDLSLCRLLDSGTTPCSPPKFLVCIVHQSTTEEEARHFGNGLAYGIARRTYQLDARAVGALLHSARTPPPPPCGRGLEDWIDESVWGWGKDFVDRVGSELYAHSFKRPRESVRPRRSTPTDQQRQYPRHSRHNNTPLSPIDRPTISSRHHHRTAVGTQRMVATDIPQRSEQAAAAVDGSGRRRRRRMMPPSLLQAAAASGTAAAAAVAMAAAPRPCRPDAATAPGGGGQRSTGGGRRRARGLQQQQQGPVLLLVGAVLLGLVAVSSVWRDRPL